MRRRVTVTLFLSCVLFSAGAALSFTGQVASILDGGTIEVLRNGKAERVRMNGIACPKTGQPYSEQAKQATSDLVFSMEVTLEIYGKDKQGRIRADVVRSDGTNVNHALVQGGWCWWDRKQAPGDSQLDALEKEARESHKGLWADVDAIPPWEWKKNPRPIVP
jgi:micrococcal nuclease